MAAVLILIALVYARGWLRLRAVVPGAVPRWRPYAFLGALLAVWAAVDSPLAACDHVLLWVHMVQHLLLSAVAAPLIWLGAPVLPLGTRCRGASCASRCSRCCDRGRCGASAAASDTRHCAGLWRRPCSSAGTRRRCFRRRFVPDRGVRWNTRAFSAAASCSGGLSFSPGRHARDGPDGRCPSTCSSPRFPATRCLRFWCSPIASSTRRTSRRRAKRNCLCFRIRNGLAPSCGAP